jgi:hypothetical protein
MAVAVAVAPENRCPVALAVAVAFAVCVAFAVAVAVCVAFAVAVAVCVAVAVRRSSLRLGPSSSRARKLKGGEWPQWIKRGTVGAAVAWQWHD